MAELTEPSCCSDAAQETCCDPEDKDACCGDGCTCAEGEDVAAA
jgi:hypothetical protein